MAMPCTNKDKVRENYVFLLENLVPDPIIKRFYARGLINKKTRDRYDQTQENERAAALLDIVQSRVNFESFLDELRYSKQTACLQVLTGDKETALCQIDSRADNLRKFGVEICENLRYEDFLLTRLLQYGIINERDKDELITINLRHKRTEELIKKLLKGCTRSRLDNFVNVLNETHQSHIAKVVSQGDTSDLITDEVRERLIHTHRLDIQMYIEQKSKPEIHQFITSGYFTPGQTQKLVELSQRDHTLMVEELLDILRCKPYQLIKHGLRLGIEDEENATESCSMEKAACNLLQLSDTQSSGLHIHYNEQEKNPELVQNIFVYHHWAELIDNGVLDKNELDWISRREFKGQNFINVLFRILEAKGKQATQNLIEIIRKSEAKYLLKELQCFMQRKGRENPSQLQALSEGYRIRIQGGDHVDGSDGEYVGLVHGVMYQLELTNNNPFSCIVQVQIDKHYLEHVEIEERQTLTLASDPVSGDSFQIRQQDGKGQITDGLVVCTFIPSISVKWIQLDVYTIGTNTKVATLDLPDNYWISDVWTKLRCKGILSPEEEPIHHFLSERELHYASQKIIIKLMHGWRTFIFKHEKDVDLHDFILKYVHLTKYSLSLDSGREIFTTDREESISYFSLVRQLLLSEAKAAFSKGIARITIKALDFKVTFIVEDPFHTTHVATFSNDTTIANMKQRLLALGFQSRVDGIVGGKGNSHDLLLFFDEKLLDDDHMKATHYGICEGSSVTVKGITIHPEYAADIVERHAATCVPFGGKTWNPAYTRFVENPNLGSYQAENWDPSAWDKDRSVTVALRLVVLGQRFKQLGNEPILIPPMIEENWHSGKMRKDGKMKWLCMFLFFPAVIGVLAYMYFVYNY